MTPESLSACAAILLSLLASYLPGFSAWFARLDPIQKRLLMLAGLALTSLACLALACAPIPGLREGLGVGVACDTPGLLAFARAFALAVIANQSAFLISPKGLKISD